jgi:hypothetical protein
MKIIFFSHLVVVVELEEEEEYDDDIEVGVVRVNPE